MKILVMKQARSLKGEDGDSVGTGSNSNDSRDCDSLEELDTLTPYSESRGKGWGVKRGGRGGRGLGRA